MDFSSISFQKSIVTFVKAICMLLFYISLQEEFENTCFIIKLRFRQFICSHAANVFFSGYVVPEPPFEMWKKHKGIDVPVIIGKINSL